MLRLASILLHFLFGSFCWSSTIPSKMRNCKQFGDQRWIGVNTYHWKIDVDIDDVCVLLSLNKHIKLIRLLHCPLFFEQKSVSDPGPICHCQYRLHSPNLHTYMLVRTHTHTQSCLLSGYKIPGNQFEWRKKPSAHNSHYNLVESFLCQFEFQFVFSLFSNIDFFCLPS